MTAPSFDVDLGVIYTHERGYMTPLLTSLAQSGQGVKMRLLLVDNASATGVSEWQDIIPATQILPNDKRLGYAENLNRILQASTARYVLLLNTDMLFDVFEQCVTKMVRFMDAHLDCGVSGCRLYHGDGSYAYPARRFQTLGTIAARRLGLSALFPRTIDSYLYRDRDRHSAFDCDWLSGCLFMVRRAAYEQVGGLDETFRKYFEDVDWCLRMSQAGWRVMFNGGTWCYHFEQRASRRVFSTDGLQHLRSYVRWLQKWGFNQAQNVPQRQTIRRAA